MKTTICLIAWFIGLCIECSVLLAATVFAPIVGAGHAIPDMWRESIADRMKDLHEILNPAAS